MRRMPQNSHRSGRSLRLPSCRPTVEVLEDRLPPGDILLGQLLNSAWVGQGAAVLGSGGNKGWMQPEPAASEYRLETLRPAVVAEAGAVASVPFFAACFVPGAGAVPETIGEAGSQQPRTRRPDYAELAGLDEEELDRLIEDDFDTLASTTGGVAPPRRAPIGAEDTIRSGLATAQESAGAGATTPATAGQAAAGVPGQGSAPPGSPGLGGLGAVPAPFPLSNVPSALLGTNPTVSPFAVSGGSGGSGGSGSEGAGDTIPNCDGSCNCSCSDDSTTDDSSSSGDLIDCAPGAYGTIGGGVDGGLGGGIGGGLGGLGGGIGGGVGGPAGGMGGGGLGGIGGSDGPAGVRYFDGTLTLRSTDLRSSGYGVAWGQTRGWTNTAGLPSGHGTGAGVIDAQQPYLVQASGGSDNTILVVSGSTEVRYYDLLNGAYVSHYFIKEALTHSTMTSEFVLTTTTGRQLHFNDFSVTPVGARGQLKSLVDPDGNSTAATYDSSSGLLTQVQRSVTVGGTTTVETYAYTYLSSPDPNAGLMSNVKLQRQVNGGTVTTVRQVSYDYYDGTSNKPYGNLGDLRTATIQDGSGNVIDTKYYRYYTSSDAGSIGYVHGLKYVFNPQSYDRLVAAVGSPLMLADTAVASYADDYYQYDSSQRVTQAVIQGSGCSACTGGLGTFTYSYSTNPNQGTVGLGYNIWTFKTVETLPDSSTNTVYANFAGEVMLKVFQSGTSTWETYYQYNSGGGDPLMLAHPSALTGYNEGLAGHLIDKSVANDSGYLNTSTGLIELTDWGTSTTAMQGVAGDVSGYFKDSKVEQGSSGTPITLTGSVQYFAQSGSGSTSPTVYPIANTTVYRNATTNLNDPAAETTSFSYTWYTGQVQVQTATVSRPIIPSTENGPGVADTETRTFDAYGRITQLTDADGFIHTTQYDPATGAVTQTAVDTAHLNLVTNIVVDNFGRPTKVTDPNGNITYTVYNDPNHEVRTYPGWQTSTNLPTGPTQVTRVDTGHSPSYTESFTMSAPPHVTSGQPDGTEAYAFLQSLSRTITSPGGQVTETDAYFNLGGIAYSNSTYLGTTGTNFYATLYAYDTPRGWRTRVQAPTGTINRTVYDALGRVVSTWVGTNDTPASGSWSPTNNTAPSNMVQLTGNVYDGGSGGGDSDLTQTFQYPGNGAAARETDNYFDWRDRLVESKQGVQMNEIDGTHRPILYSQLDNLGEVVSSERYDGDGVTITTSNGVPNRPSASLLRAQTTPQYDEQGRVFQSNTFSVDQTSGIVSTNSLSTNTWYDHRGDVIKTSPPGGLATKTSYDGAGRPTVVYQTDANGDATWSDATTVGSSNNVLSQSETTYDSDGNAILVTTRDRFDNETTGGPLGNPTTHPYARVSYVANYFDAANRLTDTVNVGTNGGTTYTRPGTPAARSDTALVTSQSYKADAVQQVALTTPPMGLMGTSASTSSLSTATHTVTANYAGDSNFPSSSGTLAGGETISSSPTAGTTTTVISSANPQASGQAVAWTAVVTGNTGPVNSVNFETGDFTQTAGHSGGSIVTSPVLDGTYNVQLARNNSIAWAEIRQTTSAYYNLATAYYSFLFEYSSNPSEGGICNFQDGSSNYKCALHLSSAGKLLFYNNAGTLIATGTTTLAMNQAYTISAKIGTGSNAAWEIRINGKVEMSGTGNLGTANNGSIKLGGGSAYTDTYDYDDVAIAALTYPGTLPTGTVQFQIDGSNFGGALPLSGGTATSPSTSALSTANHTVTASYSGDSVFPSSSGSLAGGETISASATAGSTTTLFPSANPQTSGEPVNWTAVVTGNTGPVNSVNFETGDFTQTAAHANATIATSPVLDGTYSLQLKRSNSVAYAEIRQSGTTYYNLATAYYSFLFAWNSNPSEGGIVNFQDTASGYKCALHLSSAGKLLFYNNAGTLIATGTTTLTANQVYTIAAKIGTGSNAAWEIRINGTVEISGTGNLGTNNNGSIKLGGGSAYTDTYTYDDVAINALVYPGTLPTSTVQFQVDSANFGSAVSLATPTFTLAYGGEATGPIASNATAATVQSALQGLATIGTNNVFVSGPAGGPWQVRFAGTFGGQTQPDLIANGTQLAGGTVAVGTISQGGDTGRVQMVTDPRGLITKTDYDLRGRTLRTIENYVAFAPSNSADRTTQYTYDGDDHTVSLSAVLPGYVLQTTQYVYGVTGSVISSNDLLAAVRYPPTLQPNADSYTYDALGEALTMTDRNGTTHSYTYDILGRQITDLVTTFGTGVDQAVRRIDTAFDTGGRPYLYTSSSDSGGTTIVSQVEQFYNGLGQLITEYQSHSGQVNVGSTPKVQYGYSFVGTSGGPNHSRLVSITYPNSRVLTYTYNSGVDDRISRVSSISDSSATLETYAYLGVGTVVKRGHPQSGIDLTYIKQSGESNGDAGDQYTGLDRFGRVVDQRWIPTGSPNSPTDRFQYTYDRDSNRLTRTNVVNTSFNESYGYDNLNQLTSFSRGSTHSQSWSLDAVGNWSSCTSDTSTQTRTANLQNQVTSVSGATTPLYDNNGNTTTDQNGNTYVYDAWIS